MRKSLGLIAAALCAVAVTSSIALAAIITNIDPANAPTGTHYAKTPASCTVATNGTDVSCSSYSLAGVGNANATADLTANYTAIVDCYNHGFNPNNAVESHQTSFTDASTSGALQPKNGKMSVPALSASPSGAGPSALSCPNPNWTPRIRGGSVTLSDFTYTLTFEGFSGAYITITGP